MNGIVERYLRKATRRVVGLMSGTSADAIDAALVELSGHGLDTRWRLIHHLEASLSPALRQAILALSAGRSPVEGHGPAAQVALVDAWLGEAFGAAALACLETAEVDTAEVDLVASHGQTVCHLPGPALLDGIPIRTTLQLGRGAVIAARTGLPVVNDFRSADLAAGGEGAPLVPHVDRILFSMPGRARAIQNLGGIGNVTYLPGEGSILAFDTGPANMLVDSAVRHVTHGRESFDRDGKISRQGRVSGGLLNRLMDHPFLRRPPPKSTGHEEFGEACFAEVLARAGEMGLTSADLVATLTTLGPTSAVDAYRRFLPRFPEEIILGGGGSLNPVVVETFRRLCPESRILRHEDFGIPSKAKEAMAFAILGNETMAGQPGNIPSATGASRPVVLGCLYPPPGKE